MSERLFRSQKRKLLSALAVVMAFGSKTAFALGPSLENLREHYDRYDRNAPIFTSDERAALDQCAFERSNERSSFRQSQCQSVERRRYAVSDSPAFLALSSFRYGAFGAYWAQQRFLVDSSGALSPRQSRVYGELAMRSPHDAFVEAAARWRSNAEFGCLPSVNVANANPADQRPGVAWFLHRHFRTQAPDCLRDQKVPFVLADGATREGEAVWLAPSDIATVQIALIGPGESFLSQWGHLALILTPRSGEPLVLNFHFQYNGQDVDRQSMMSRMLDGLRGQYVARLLPSTLESQIQHYVVKNRQTFQSWTLQMTEDEKTQLLYAAFESFAFYRGEWRHLSSNCVSHILDLLKIALPDFALSSLRTDSLRPAEAIALLKKELAPTRFPH